VVVAFAASPEPRAGSSACSPAAGAAGQPLARQSLRWRFPQTKG